MPDRSLENTSVALESPRFLVFINILTIYQAMSELCNGLISDRFFFLKSSFNIISKTKAMLTAGGVKKTWMERI